MILLKTRICKKCGETKPIEMFVNWRLGIKKDGEIFTRGFICEYCNCFHNIIPANISKQFNININIIRKHPSLVKSWMGQIKTKQLLKQKKHENVKTS